MKSKTSKIRVNYCLNIVLVFVVFIVSVNATTTTVNTSSSLPVNIPDTNTNFVCIGFPVTGVPSGENVIGVSVAFGFQSSCAEDVQVELRNPGGTIHQLFGHVSLRCSKNPGTPDMNGIYTFIDTASLVMNAQEGIFIQPGSYRSANYTSMAATSINAKFFGMTSAQANGTWQLCGQDLNSLGGSPQSSFITSASLTINSSVPTGANTSVNGRILTPSGNGISGAFVTLTDQQGNSRTVRTNPFGYFRFDDVEAGQSYVVSASAKGHRFTPQLISVNDNIEALTITGQ